MKSGFCFVYIGLTGACEENKVRHLFCNNAPMFYRDIVEYVINNSLYSSQLYFKFVSWRDGNCCVVFATNKW